MNAPLEPKIPRPGRSLLLRFALGLLAIMLLSAGATATAGLLEVKEISDIISQGEKIPGVENVLDDVDGGGPQTILLLGSDIRYGDSASTPARSDTIMLVRLDPDKEATAVLSIPRDLEVRTPVYSGKINGAYNGGPTKSLRAIKALLDIPISHIVNVNFNGFQRAVNKLGCVYVDVDRRYFNDRGGPGGYATIDLKPGYQRMCGKDSLDYVRFRHTDSDFVRAARQQSFLRQAKDQYGLSKLFGSRIELVKILKDYTQTDIRSDTAILRLFKLAYLSSGHPVRTVHFDVYQQGEGVYISPTALARARSEFMDARASKGPPPTGKTTRKKKKTTTSSKKKRATKTTARPLAPGVVHDHRPAEDYVAAASTRIDFPLYYAADRIANGGFYSEGPRVYDIYDRARKRYRAYRITNFYGETGQYYGIQGTTWKAPPILDNPSERRSIGGRTFDLFFDGSRLRLIAYRTDRAVYWISNTLSEKLTNKQMFSIARSLRPVGS